MTAGQLRHRLQIEAVTGSSKNSFGERIITATGMTYIWGNVEPLSGKELIAAKQVASRTTHKVTIRWRDDINARTRLRFNGRTLDIESAINPGEQNRWLTLMCMEST